MGKMQSIVLTEWTKRDTLSPISRGIYACQAQTREDLFGPFRAELEMG